MDIEQIPIGPGAYRVRYSQPDNINNGTIHVIGFVDGDWLVCRTWLKRENTWRYHIEHKYRLQLMIHMGYAKCVKSDPRPDQTIYSEGYSYREK